jgi:hypothetical protein
MISLVGLGFKTAEISDEMDAAVFNQIKWRYRIAEIIVVLSACLSVIFAINNYSSLITPIFIIGLIVSFLIIRGAVSLISNFNFKLVKLKRINIYEDTQKIHIPVLTLFVSFIIFSFAKIYFN